MQKSLETGDCHMEIESKNGHMDINSVTGDGTWIETPNQAKSRK
jgi:hypothetical protein